MASTIRSSCINCAVCEPVCPTGSITAGAQKFVIDSDTCTDCGHCIPACPVAAIKPEKKKQAG